MSGAASRGAAVLLAVLLAIALAACGPGSEAPDSQTNIALVEDQYAYHVGVLAYLYGYPLVDQYRRAHNARLTSSGAPAPTELDPMRSLGFFEVLNLVLRETPPEAGTEALMAQFDQVGVGPSVTFSQAALSPARKRGLERAIRDARSLLEAAPVASEPGEFDYLGRAARYRELNP